MDWITWFDRWEAMQNAYLPQRERRFDLMALLAGYATMSDLYILDLGCGPGALAFRMLEHFPRARVLGVDTDPVLLRIGEEAAAERGASVEFRCADLRDGGWWGDHAGAFDMVVSATALHWLNEDHLREVYARVYGALKPGGWFFNADHIASDDPATQAQYRDVLHAWQSANFELGIAEDWDMFWAALGQELADFAPELWAARGHQDVWEGSDDGLSRGVHLEVLRECGFERAALHWQELGEALLGAQKPLWNIQRLLDGFTRLKAVQHDENDV